MWFESTLRLEPPKKIVSFKLYFMVILNNCWYGCTYNPICIPHSIRNRAPSRLYRASVSGSMPSLNEGVFFSSLFSKNQAGIFFLLFIVCGCVLLCVGPTAEWANWSIFEDLFTRNYLVYLWCRRIESRHSKNVLFLSLFLSLGHIIQRLAIRFIFIEILLWYAYSCTQLFYMCLDYCGVFFVRWLYVIDFNFLDVNWLVFCLLFFEYNVMDFLLKENFK